MPAADHDGRYTQLVHKVTQRARTLYPPWLPQTSTPRRWTSLSIMLGPEDAAFSGWKERRGRYTRSATFICCLELRWRLICSSSFLPFLPIRALPLAARSQRLLCAEDPPLPAAAHPPCWKTNTQEEKCVRGLFKTSSLVRTE